MVYTGRDLNRSSSSIPPAMGRDTFHLDQGVQSPIQTGLEHFLGGGIHRFSGKKKLKPQIQQAEAQ